MKYYKDDSDAIYADPLPAAISEKGLTEIETPCYNGKRLPKHILADNVETDDDGNYYYSYNDDGTVNSDEQESYELQQISEVEYCWAKSEIEDADIQVNYCLRGNSKAVGTKFEWWAYQEACCDYASCDDDGVYSVVDMSDIDTDSDDYLFKRTYEDVEYIVAIDDSGRPISPSDGGVSSSE